MSFFSTSIFLVAALLLISSVCRAQAPDASPKGAPWTRIQSDNGEFSIEMPASYRHYANAKGFSVTRPGASYPENYDLRKMVLVNSVVEGSLVSFESYEANSSALRGFTERDELRKDTDVEELKLPEYKMWRSVFKGKEHYFTRVYFHSKKTIYILSAGVRGESESPAIKRFLGSLKFTPNRAHDAAADSVKVSQLKFTDVQVEMNSSQSDPPRSGPAKTPAVIPDPDDKGLVILDKPLASFTEAARANRSTGTAVLRVTFEADGNIQMLKVEQGLSDGLLRQVLMAAIRMKFLPKEVDGKAVTVSRRIEYSFNIF